MSAATTDRRIAHLDMDAFYASVELLRYPQLRGQAVVVAGREQHQPVRQADGQYRFARLRDYTGRGVVTTSTYEARALGVFSGMGVMKAAQLAPDAILLPADFDAYRHHSRLFKQAVAQIAPRIEDRGIDEIYIDLSDLPEDSLTLARRLKQAVREATGLSCSIGVTPNKLLSKICSDLQKPDGITLLAADEVPSRIWPLPARKINGIGPKAAERLAAMGIHTIADLAQAPAEKLQAAFGAHYARWLLDAAHGRDTRPVETRSEPKSISRETTFEQDLHPKSDRAALTTIFNRLCERVADDLRRKGYVGRTIGIKIRFADFRTLTRDISLPEPIADAAAIRQACNECLRRTPVPDRIRLLGVRVGSLQRHDPAQTRTASRPAARQGELPF